MFKPYLYHFTKTEVIEYFNTHIRFTEEFLDVWLGANNKMYWENTKTGEIVPIDFNGIGPNGNIFNAQELYRRWFYRYRRKRQCNGSL